MKFLNYFFYIIIINFISSNIHCEYIVFQQDNQEILPIFNESEYQKIYKVLQTYQWPMILANTQKLPEKELGQLIKTNVENAEEKFLRNKIKEISPKYDLVFIPTLLYEMFYVAHLSNYKYKKLSQGSFKDRDLSYMTALQLNINDLLKENKVENKVLSIVNDPNNNVHTIYNFFNKINLNNRTQTLHQLINNGLVQLINKNPGIDIQENIDSQKMTLLENVIKLKATPWKFNYLASEVALNKIIDLEYEARKKNLIVLYRGGKARKIYIVGTKGTFAPIEGSFLATERPENVPATPAPTFEKLQLEYKEGSTSTKIRDWQQPLNSVSYANSIFGGYWEDEGACACSYLAKPELIGYSLFINKEKYITGKLNLFFISSLNTLNSMFGEGEFFHSRTRAFAPLEYFIQHKGNFYVPGFSGVDFDDNAGIFAPIGDPLEKAKELSEFIQLNSRILKLPDSEKGFNALPEDEMSYIKAQKELTEMLKAMNLIRKYVRKKKALGKEEIESESMETFSFTQSGEPRLGPGSSTCPPKPHVSSRSFSEIESEGWKLEERSRIVPAKGKRKAEEPEPGIEKPLKKLEVQTEQ